MKRLAERLRWRLIGFVVRLPGQCWADLFPYALYGSEGGNRRPWAPTVTYCRDDANRVGHCYCGKVEAEPWAAAVHDAHLHEGWTGGGIDAGVRCSCGWMGQNWRDHLAGHIALARLAADRSAA